MSTDDFDTTMLELFREEADTQLGALAEALVALETAAEPRALLDDLMRAAHSMKGAARIVGLDPVVKLAHSAEDIFVAALRGELQIGAGAVDVLLTTSDLIGAIARGEGEPLGARGAEITALLEQLAAVRRGESPASGQMPQTAGEASVSAASEPPATAIAMPPAPEAVAETAPSVVEPQGPAAEGGPAEAGAQVEAPVGGSTRVGATNSVRMSTDTLARLTALGAEAFVEGARIEQIVDDAPQLRERQRVLQDTLERMRRELRSDADTARFTDTLEEAIVQMDACKNLLGEREARIEQYARRAVSLASRLSRETLASRMLPFGSILRGYPRLVRDLARELGKRCRLELKGEHTQIDREILDRLDTALNHIVRNALDHGLEDPQQRESVGKIPEGRLAIEAHHRAGRLHVTVQDDGRGINAEKLREAVVARGLENAQNAAALSADELHEFLFLPGFSTAARLTEISGRGVGLDAVRTMVQEAGGSITLTSTPGKGTRFDLELPVTRSVARVLLVRIAGDAYALPIARIERALVVGHDGLKSLEGRSYFESAGERVALVPAAEILDLGEAQWNPESLRVVVLREGSRCYGLVVDAFTGERELLVRPVDPRFGEIPDVAALSTDENGAIVVILDVDQLLRSMDGLITGGRLQRRGNAGGAGERTSKRILVVDDSLTVRQAERQLLENRGYSVDVAVDGLEGWSAVRLADYDLVVTDVDMPRMNGIELVRKIRQEGRNREIPIVIVSYKDREEDRLRGLEAGANHYLAKGGFRDTALIEVVQDLIGGPEREP